jgi:hypothetical protein
MINLTHMMVWSHMALKSGFRFQMTLGWCPCIRSCPEPGGGSWSYGTYDSSGAALSQVAGAGAAGHLAVLELP